MKGDGGFLLDREEIIITHTSSHTTQRDPFLSFLSSFPFGRDGERKRKALKKEKRMCGIKEQWVN